MASKRRKPPQFAIQVMCRGARCPSEKRPIGSSEGPAPAPGTVLNQHLALENTARDETEHHFLRMKDFNGYADTVDNGNPNGWTKAQECQWARLQDRFHEEWMNGIMQGQWPVSRRAETAHQLAHLCMNIRDSRLKARFACDFEFSEEQEGHPKVPITDCPVMSCEDYLKSQFP